MLTEGEKASIRATALFIIKSIVKKYDGDVELDLATNTIHITKVDKELVGACAREIEEQIGLFCN